MALVTERQGEDEIRSGGGRGRRSRAHLEATGLVTAGGSLIQVSQPRVTATRRA